MHEENCFITLTYDDEHLPEDYSLDVRHFQLFMKRLRNELVKEAKEQKREPTPVRFFHCGEYGDIKGRPHYHAALFGISFQGERKFWKRVRGNNLYTSERLAGLWPLGFSSIGELTFESAAYIARYVMKKVNGDKAQEHYAVCKKTGLVGDRKSEYTTMSRRPGIGKEWLKRFGSDVYPDDFVVDSRKRKSKPPKYYDGQYEIDEPEEMQKIKARRVHNAGKRRADSTPDRLAVREKVQELKEKRLLRELE